MTSREKFSREHEPKPKAWVTFGGPSHEGEYIFIVKHEGEFIPSEMSVELEKGLGADWWVSDRGTRIEIVNRKKYGSRDDEKILGAIRRVLGEEYDFTSHL